MSITPKPFTAGQGIVRSVFKSKPAIFSAEDLNRQLDVIDYSTRKNSLGVGLQRTNLMVTKVYGTIPSSPNGYGTYTFDVQITIAKVNGALDALIFAKGCEVIITPETITKSFTFANPSYIGCYLYLIAKRHTVTYSEGAVMSGIQLTSPSASFASSDTVVYEDARLALIQDDEMGDSYTVPNDQDLNLASEEEILGIIWSYTKAIEYNTFNTPTVVGQEKYHATEFSDILHTLPFYDEVMDEEVHAYHNASLVDMFLQYMKVANQRIEKLESYFINMPFVSLNINGSGVGAYLSLQSSLATHEFTCASNSILSCQKIFNRIFVQFYIVYDYIGSAATLGTFFLKIPNSFITKTGVAVHGMCSIVNVNSGGIIMSAVCHISGDNDGTGDGGHNYVVVGETLEVQINTSPFQFLATGIAQWTTNAQGIISGSFNAEIVP